MSSLYLNSPPSTGGILLNGPLRQRNFHSQTHDKHSATRSLPPSAKIRFAPLPDPRRPLTDDDKSPPHSPLLSSTKSEPQPLPGNYSDSRQSDETDREVEGRVSRRNKPKKTFMKKFLSVNTTPIQDATNTLGLGLFRANSRDSASSSDDVASSAADVSSAAISKRKRSRSNSSTKDNKDSSSAFSLSGKSKRSISPFSLSRNSNNTSGPASASATLGSQMLPVPSPRLKNQPLRPTISAPSTVESPIRMLNGRVYGKQAQQGRQTDWKEPEFVEWGYGGMGSVRSGEAFYGGVQSGSSVVGVDDDYEASGMGWVKRRRAEKERKEREAREKAEQELRDAEGGSEASSPCTPKIVISEHEHDTRTVSIPHHHHTHHSRHSSRGTTPRGSAVSVPTLASPVKKVSQTHRREDSSSSSSQSSELDDEGSPRGDDDDDEDEEEEIRDEKRATSICAGKEKFSRHHRE